jgi:probable phosphoglycerate mutase
MTHIVIVRHGTTQWMEWGLVHGVRDSSLSARGRGQAQSVASRLQGEHFDAFYTSPAGRAVETAAVISQAVGLRPAVLEGLREIDFGWIEGRPMLSTDGSRIPGLGQARRLLRFAAYAVTGERWPHVRRRVGAALESIVSKHPAGRVLIVTHHGTHNALLQLILRPRRFGPTIFPLAPCGMTEVEIDALGKGRLIALNRTDHLGPGKAAG